MPYIALQLIGIQVVVAAMGIAGHGWLAEAPLVIAFVILAAYTYQSGLRAPALIAVVKDLIIYVTVVAAVIVGFGSPWRAFAAGLVLGLAESTIASANLSGVELGPAYRDVIPIAVALLVVALRRRQPAALKLE